MELQIIITAGIGLIAIIAAFIIGRRSGNKEDVNILQTQNNELKQSISERDNKIESLTREVTSLTSERDVQHTTAKSLQEQLDKAREEAKAEQERQALFYEKQLQQQKEHATTLVEQFKDMSKEQSDNQLALIKEQIQTTSEKVLKARQEELGERNIEQVQKIVDPLNLSLKMMRDALDSSKKEHQETITRLDATIQANMKNSQDLGQTAERLTRALTGEVKVQGNFGELKLRQLL